MKHITHPPKKNVKFVIAGLLFVILAGSNFMFAHASPNQQATVSPTPTATPFECTSWSLAGDFRAYPDQENPSRDSCNNLNVWEYVGATAFTHNSSGISGLDVWGNTSMGPYVAINASGGVILGNWAPGTIHVHPSPTQMVVMAWHSPVSGYVSVVGMVSDDDAGGGDGVLWYVDLNTTNLADGYVNANSQAFANGNNGASLNTVQVSVGDVLYFNIHPNGNYYYDSTQVDVIISITSSPTNTPTSTPTVTATPAFTPTDTPTSTPTSMATSTATETITITPTPTIGTWYTGNKRFDAYGVKAIISVPSQAPYLVDYQTATGQKSGESSWVSIPMPFWVQVGWKYYYGYTYPKRYLEWNLPNIPPGEAKVHDFHLFGEQVWGTTSVYEILWGGGTTWCGMVDNNLLECFDTEQQYAPIDVLARSEVHASLLNELNTTFSQIYYLSPNSWELFDQDNWREDAPYAVDKIQYYEYRNFGP